MRILSEFKDYYDRVQIHGDDKELVYVRHTHEFKLDDVRSKFSGSWSSKCPRWNGTEFRDFKRNNEFFDGRSSECQIDNVTVFFCGKQYRLFLHNDRVFTSPMKIFEAIEDGTIADNLKPIENFNYQEPIDRFYRRKKSLVEIMRSIMEREKRRKFYSFGDNAFPCNEQGWNAFIAENGGQSIEVPTNVFRNFDAPVILIQNEYEKDHRQQVLVNPRLNDFGFASVVDPFTAYQEIDMFLGSALARQNDPVPVRTQELIRDAHGFDNMSFKQYAPGDKKKRRAENRERKRSKMG